MKTLKLLGIIALLALIVFWAIGCDLLGEEEVGELEGTLTIQVLGDGPYFTPLGDAVICTLRAYYNGDEDITYEWFRDSTSVVVGTTGTEETYVPRQAGDYQVKIKPVGAVNDDYAKFAANGPVTITAAPAQFKLFGTWDMFAVDNGNWKADKNPSTGNTNEVVVITSTSFRLDSSFNGYTSINNYTAANVGVSQATAQKFDLTAPFEFLEYTITGWEPLTTGLPTGYDGGFTVTVNTAQSRSKGYTGIEDSSFRIYYKDGVEFSAKTGLVFQWAKSNGTFYDTSDSSGVHRTYVKR